MCTIVQKDVLIELVANAQAFLGKRLPLPLNDDQILLAKLRSSIYRTSHNDLDYELLVSQIKNISDKYHYYLNDSEFIVTDDFMKNYDFKADVEKQFPKVWVNLLAEKNIIPQQNPIGVILGGQPGAGKSFGTEKISNDLNGNVLIINGDEFRTYHNYFEKIGEIYKKDLANKTQEFSNEMVNRVKNEAFNNRFNVIIEGTFRTIQTPLNELNNLKDMGYKTGIIICTCPKEVSWKSTIERGDEQKEKGLPPRYVPKESHDSTVNNLSSNVEYVYQNGKPDFLDVYSRSKKLFDSKIDSVDKLKSCIDSELKLRL